jgi:rSAM/selenodomain-associated transferase 1
MVDAEETPVVVVLTRAPSFGGKSRLFAALGRPSDPALLSALLLDTLDGVGTGAWSRVVAVTPGDACDEVRPFLPPDVQVIPQPEGSLGDRMRSIMHGVLARCATPGIRRPVALIGSDLPGMTPQPLHDAFEALSREPEALVLGPAVDGGYYLIAATRVPDVFNGIAWGTRHVLQQTRDAATRLGLHVQLVEPMNDVDTVGDLKGLPSSARRTQAWIRFNG